jgi:hypothetical protein
MLQEIKEYVKCVQNQKLKMNLTFYWFVHAMIILEKMYIKKYYHEKPSNKLIQLVSTENITDLRKLGKYFCKFSRIRSENLP